MLFIDSVRNKREAAVVKKFVNTLKLITQIQVVIGATGSACCAFSSFSYERVTLQNPILTGEKMDKNVKSIFNCTFAISVEIIRVIQQVYCIFQLGFVCVFLLCTEGSSHGIGYIGNGSERWMGMC